MKLFILNGPEKGRSFDLKPDTTIVGRSSDSNIQIKDTSVSRKHLKILSKGKKVIIEDLKSVNGTFVNGTQIDPGGKSEVKLGVPISVGNIYFSLGKIWESGVLPFPDSIDYSSESIDYRELGAGRPMTTPKNL